jgi:hypothetical protein
MTEQLMTVSAFSIRQFLRNKKALLIHFNTPMSEHPDGFPLDLRNAIGLKGIPLSFSTIQATDKGPSQVPVPADANSGGSVGLIVDIKDAGSVVTVGPGDDGTKAHVSGNHQSGGSSPTDITCEKSIACRTSTNEWFVQDYIPLGIFTFLPPRAFWKGNGEGPIELEDVLNAFQSERVFTTISGSFQEWDRDAECWRLVEYDDIVPA